MPDILSNFMSWLSGNQMLVAIIGMAAVIMYLVFTRKPKQKEFKPLDLKKEVKRRYNKEYKYFHTKLNMPIYETDNDRPFGWVLGYMKVVWIERLKRYEPVHQNFSKEVIWQEMQKDAVDVYQKKYEELDDIQKKNIAALAKEELRDRQIEEVRDGEQNKFVRGKKEVIVNEPVPGYLFKITKPDFMHKLLAKMVGVGCDYFDFKAEQIEFLPEALRTTGDFQRAQAFDVFVFNKEGRARIQDVSFGVERENIWQETANQIPRAVHFDTEASKSLVLRREDAHIEAEKYKHQKEGAE